MKWTLALLLVIVLAVLTVLFVRKQQRSPRATLQEVEHVLNNFPQLLPADDFMKFYETSREETEAGYLSTSVIERATRSYKDHVQTIIFFPPISTDDAIVARDQMTNLRMHIDAALAAKLKIARSMIWARPLSTTVTKWSETDNEANEAARALYASIQLLENK